MLIRWFLAAINRISIAITTFYYSIIFGVRLRIHGAVVGEGLNVLGWVHLSIHYTAKVIVGSACRINSGFGRNPVGNSNRMCIWVGKGGTLVIGDKVGISNSTIVAMECVSIGDNAFIGGDCKIYDTDFHPVSSLLRVDSTYAKANTAAVSIGPRSFIGGHSIVLKGVHIGEGAVIGAGSVITKDVPAYEIWAGNPARYIRKIS